MPTLNNDTASQLLELHVKHEVASLKGAKLRKFLKQEVNELLDHAGNITLNRVASENQVTDTLQRVVVNMELNAGVPELAAEMATEVLNAPIQETTTLGDIVTQGQVTGFLDTALELRHQRERIISEIIAHPIYQELISNMV